MTEREISAKFRAVHEKWETATSTLSRDKLLKLTEHVKEDWGKQIIQMRRNGKPKS